MAELSDPSVQRLLVEQRNHAVVSTTAADGTVHSTVVWVGVEDGRVGLNSAVGRFWSRNLERDPRITVLVYDESDPYQYVEIRGTATSTTEGAVAHNDRLARKYLGVDRFTMGPEGQERLTVFVEPVRIRFRARD